MFGEGNIGRCSKRQGDWKRKLDTADLLNLFQDLDVRQAKFHFFVAAVMFKILGIRPIDSDVVSLSATVVDLKQQIQYIHSSLKSSMNNLQLKVKLFHSSLPSGRVETGFQQIPSEKSSVSAATKLNTCEDSSCFPELTGQLLAVNLLPVAYPKVSDTNAVDPK